MRTTASRYGASRSDKSVEQLELPLWSVLREAAIAPDEADVGQLLDVLDKSLSSLETQGQLQVAAEAIAQIVQVSQVRSMVAFEELEATASDEGPVMPADAFDRYVRQTMEVDFEPFIEPIESLPRKAPQLQALMDGESIIGELDQAALLQAFNEQMAREPGLTEVEAFNRATLAVLLMTRMWRLGHRRSSSNSLDSRDRRSAYSICNRPWKCR